MKPQQLQRYEASDYQTASFARLREIARLLGLRVRETVLADDALRDRAFGGRPAKTADWHREWLVRGQSVLHLLTLAERVKEGANGTGLLGLRFNTIGVRDGSEFAVTFSNDQRVPDERRVYLTDSMLPYFEAQTVEQHCVSSRSLGECKFVIPAEKPYEYQS